MFFKKFISSIVLTSKRQSFGADSYCSQNIYNKKRMRLFLDTSSHIILSKKKLYVISFPLSFQQVLQQV